MEQSQAHRLDSPTPAAIQATLHCLTGCAIGEILGMVLATALTLGNAPSLRSRSKPSGSRFADSVASPSAPGNGGTVFRYRLHSPDGDDLGEATYAQR